MTSPASIVRRPLRKLALLVCACAMAISIAHAEAPMNTDDAGTLDRGGMKAEGVWSKDDKTRRGEMLFGFSPLHKLELAVLVSRAQDGGTSPACKRRGAGLGAKWVPYRNETGWSLGGRFDFGHTRIHDPEADERYSERNHALTGLASWRRENGQVLHLNLGAARRETRGQRDNVGTWGIGYEFPLVEKLKLTAETFGEDHSRPNKAIGLRYEVFAGFKVSGAVGRGNDRRFGQVGVAWEF
jgi:hypothetical protein